MAKKQRPQQKQQKKPPLEIQRSASASSQNPQTKNLRQRQLTQFLSKPKPSTQEPKTFKRNLQQELEPLRKQSVHSEKQKVSVPSKLKKTISKKKKGKGKSKANQASEKGGVKLQRGYKFCQNCQTVLNIHKYVCTECGFVHNMKKHKFDVMKNLSKGTPKIVKSIIEANEFNSIKFATQASIKLFPSSFSEIFTVAESFETKKSVQGELKRAKSESTGSNKPLMTRGKSQSGVKNQNHLNKQNIRQKQDVRTINFEPLSITHLQDLSFQKQKGKSIKKYNKTREQFSIFQSTYPITVMEDVEICNSFQRLDQYLLFGEIVSKKEVFHQENRTINMEEEDSINSESENGSEDMEYHRGREGRDDTKNKKEKQKINFKKIRENNSLTQKALGLQKFHRLGAFYEGQTILNVMKVSRISQQTSNDAKTLNKKIDEEIPEKPIRRSSGRLSKPERSKETLAKVEKTAQALNQNQHQVIKIGLKEHVEAIKTIKNKVAVLTGKKSILLMNLNINNEGIQEMDQNGEGSQNSRDIVWLKGEDFARQKKQLAVSNKKQLISKKYFSKISLSKTEIPTISDDIFTTIEWLKLFSQYHSKIQNETKKPQNQSFLAAGTLHGHIIIFIVSPQNQYSIYRSIITAHFQLINCIKECPLNNDGSSIFASASYDGSVKVWDLNHKATICEFQVSNRKIQEIHWDSGAKFLIVVRDQGLQNCYIACFYSVNNRLQLPLMLADAIDFRMIRNGVLFENSCSPLITFPLNSKLIVMLNAKNGFLKILESEEMRKTSLKRKKSKKNYVQDIYHDYWIRPIEGKTHTKDDESNFSKQLEKIMETNGPYQIVQMMANVNQGIYTKLGLTSVQQASEESESQKAESLIQQSESANEEQDLAEKQNDNKKDKKTTKNVQKSEVIPQNLDSTGIRKSLRARKPVVQYNLVDDEQPEQEKPKKLVNRKNNQKKRQSSDSEESYDDDEDESSEFQESESEKSFEQKNKISQNQQKKVSSNGKQKNKSKEKQKSKKNKSKVFNNKNSQKEDKQKQEGLNSEELLYKLFWQETNEESLVNHKEEYPGNRFPKFSSIVSFVSLSENNKSEVELEKKGQQNGMQKNAKKKVGSTQKNYKKKKQKQQELQQNSQQNSKNQESAKDQSQLQNSEKEASSNSQKVQKKNRITQKKSEPQTKGTNQEKTEYMTTFIAGFEGQLIKIVIKIQGYDKTSQNQA